MRRGSVADLPTGPEESKSIVLFVGAISVAFRNHTLLLLDGCLYAPQASIAHHTRSHCIALHRILATLSMPTISLEVHLLVHAHKSRGEICIAVGERVRNLLMLLVRRPLVGRDDKRFPRGQFSHK